MEYTIVKNKDNNWGMDEPHLHDRIEILLSMTDGGNFFMMDNLHPIRKGTLAVMQEYVPHKSIVPDYGYERYVLHFPRSVFYDAYAGGDELSYIYDSNCVFQLDNEEYAELLSQMEKCNTSSDGLGDEILRICAFMTVLVMVGRLIKSSARKSIYPQRMSEPVRKAVQMINAEISADLTLDKISERCYVTKYHLCRQFKKETGFTVTGYISHLRVLRAAELLKEGKSVQKSGEESGFANYNNFIRSFGQIMGISPGRYKKQWTVER